ncbi:retron system putative HNH endonuclease [Sulfurospirillum multivorans]|uniref:HNH domain-containing protein n=2 Tax=Sulfurospirillum multivorans TaxID=66821 RepID=A0AA86DXT8_SULMK|nr:retron system putative HNH endonuclease [Sulfurospirillum multivorans]AHJ12458.1 hypothetical protein SMUL_1195 [Sulfurospirillum multivorans DSM 12446]QEH05953.1 hypothetical protein SMN_1182 [Sulfurospirillum multivorans]
MTKVEKNFEDIPSILKHASRKDAFEKNVNARAYSFGKTLYKTKEAQKNLKEIYHLKCAFCEKKLLDADKHIEHYRSKNTYYWLAYSWDNLLLACGNCNRAKGKKFKTENSKVIYKNETFEEIHALGKSYDEIEKPFIIHPEKEDVLQYIKYDKEGKVSSENPRVQHTIEEACKLNREELVQKRLSVLNDFINQINKHYILFTQEKSSLSRFKPDIETFIEKADKESEFYSFRYFILHNIEIFFENKNIQKILISFW